MKRVLFAFLLLAPAAAAQSSFNGVVEKITTPTLCPGFQHQVSGTNTYLTSSVLDLDALVGDVSRLTGTVTPPSVVCPNWIFDVTAADLPTATLESCGTPRPGCTMHFRIGPPTISLNSLFYSVTGPTFLDLGDPLGVAFLSPPYVLAGTATSGNDIVVPIPPGAPVGVTVQLQGHHLDVGPIQGPGSLTNPVSITFQPQGPLCVDPTACW